MGAEVLIVGEPTQRAGLGREIGRLGYGVELLPPHSVVARLNSGELPRVIVVCLADIDPPLFMAELRRVQRGAAIPVTLCGRLGAGAGVLGLADVLDLGADHFLEEPLTPEVLGAALDALAGPPVSGPWRPAMSDPSANSDAQVLAGSERDRGVPGLRSAQPTPVGFDERGHSDETAPEPDDLDLAALGLEPLPDVDVDGAGIDPGESQDRLEIPDLQALVARAGARPGGERKQVGNPRETTVLLEDSAPRVEPGPPPGTDSITAGRPARPLASAGVTAEVADQPRPAPPLPLERGGDLADVEVPRLLCSLARSRVTGRLVLTSGLTQKTLWLSGGNLVFAASNLSHDRLIEGLLETGVLTRSQYDMGRRLTDHDRRRAGQVLVEAGLLKPGELFGVVQDQLARIVASTLGLGHGTWILDHGVRCDEPILLSTPTAALVVQGVGRRLEPELLWGWLGGPHRYPMLRQRAWQSDELQQEIIQGFGLDPDQAAVLPTFDGQRRLGDLLGDAGAKEPLVLPLVYGLWVFGALDFHGEPMPQPAVAQDQVAIDRERIEARLVLAREADYFAVLGLDRAAFGVEVRERHAELQATFADDRLDPETPGIMAAELRELRAVLAEACQVLQDDVWRSAYLAQLEDP